MAVTWADEWVVYLADKTVVTKAVNLVEWLVF
jgi:hypothetical protein